MVGVRVRRQEPNRHISVARPFDAPGGEDTVGVAVDEPLQHHLGRILFRSAAPPVDLQRGEIHLRDSLHDEVNHVVLRSPLAQVRLIEGLRQLGCEVALPNRRRLKAILPEDVEIHHLYTLAKQLSIQIRSLEYKRDSLEDIFLRAMEES